MSRRISLKIEVNLTPVDDPFQFSSFTLFVSKMAISFFLNKQEKGLVANLIWSVSLFVREWTGFMRKPKINSRKGPNVRSLEGRRLWDAELQLLREHFHQLKREKALFGAKSKEGVMECVK